MLSLGITAPTAGIRMRIKLGRWGSMIDSTFALNVSQLSVLATVALVVFVALRKRRIGLEKAYRAAAKLPATAAPKGWPEIPAMEVGNVVNQQGVRLQVCAARVPSPRRGCVPR